MAQLLTLIKHCVARKSYIYRYIFEIVDRQIGQMSKLFKSSSGSTKNFHSVGSVMWLFRQHISILFVSHDFIDTIVNDVCVKIKDKPNNNTQIRFARNRSTFPVFGCKTLTCIMKLKCKCILGVAIKLSNRVFMEFLWWFIIVVWNLFLNNCLKTMVYWAKPIKFKTIASSNATLL